METYYARSVVSLTIVSGQFCSPPCLASTSESFQCGRFGAIHFDGSVGIGAHASISRWPWASTVLRETEKPPIPSADNAMKVRGRGTRIAPPACANDIPFRRDMFAGSQPRGFDRT